MATLRSRRPIMLMAMAAFALVVVFSSLASLAATSASASVPRVRDLVIRSIALDPQTKVATVRGAVTCTGGDYATVYVDVSQTVGRLHTVEAQGNKDIACDGRVRFSLRLKNVQGRLGPGEANVDAFAITCTPEACYGTDFTKVVRVTNAQ